MQKKSTQPLLSEAKKQHTRSPRSHPSSTIQFWQPLQPSETTSKTSAATSDVSKRVDEALDKQRTITGQLDEQIAGVKAKLSEQLQQGTFDARPSSLRWNLVPDEHIISPRRSRHNRLPGKLSGVTGSRSPSRQTLPLFDPANSGQVPAFYDANTPFTRPSPTVASSGLTSGQILPPATDTQNYTQSPNFSV